MPPAAQKAYTTYPYLMIEDRKGSSRNFVEDPEA